MTKANTSTTEDASGKEPGDILTFIKVAFAIAVLSIALLAMIREYSLQAHPPIPVPPVLSAQQVSTNATLRQLSNQCMGNFSLLTPTEQAQANRLSNGQGAVVVSLYYKADPSRMTTAAAPKIHVNQ